MDKYIDKIYRLVDKLCWMDRFDLIDLKIAKFIDSEFLINNPDIILAYLTITLPCKSKLKNRKQLWLIAKAIFDKENLRGLE